MSHHISFYIGGFKLENCKLCAFNCNVNRDECLGRCKCGASPKLALASIHMWEEPCISGTNGSGTSIKVAGDDFDEAIVRYMRKKHNLLIGERTAEDIKIKIGTTYPLVDDMVMEVRGRNLVTGLPKTVTVTSSETEEALKETTAQIVEAVIAVLERTPPELSADILDRGIVLTGGGALLRGLEELIEEKTGINTMTAEDPMKVVAIGTGQFVEFMSGK